MCPRPPTSTSASPVRGEHYGDDAAHDVLDAVHGTIVATVTLRDALAAQRTVDRLHHMPLEGHKLVATLIKPGARYVSAADPHLSPLW